MSQKKSSGFQAAAGLVRYFEEEKTGYKVDPRLVLVMGIATAVIITILHISG